MLGSDWLEHEAAQEGGQAELHDNESGNRGETGTRQKHRRDLRGEQVADAHTDTGAQKHRHTGTQAYRHTGIQTHRQRHMALARPLVGR